MWGKIIIPMYRLWLQSLYGLYGPRCPLSPKRLINLISLFSPSGIALTWTFWNITIPAWKDWWYLSILTPLAFVHIIHFSIFCLFYVILVIYVFSIKLIIVCIMYMSYFAQQNLHISIDWISILLCAKLTLYIRNCFCNYEQLQWYHIGVETSDFTCYLVVCSKAWSGNNKEFIKDLY